MINKEISIVWTEEKLNEILTMPSKQLVEDIKKIDGDIMVLGAGGKMGPTLCVLAKKACQEAGIEKRIIASTSIVASCIIFSVTSNFRYSF